MSRALSVDLRERVVRAVSEGASCRAAAARLGVSASSAIRWCSRRRETGSVVPGALRGDRRSGRIEAHAALILQEVERTPDIVLSAPALLRLPRRAKRSCPTIRAAHRDRGGRHIDHRLLRPHGSRARRQHDSSAHDQGHPMGHRFIHPGSRARGGYSGWVTNCFRPNPWLLDKLAAMEAADAEMQEEAMK